MEGVPSVPNGTSVVDLADSIARRLATIMTNGVSVLFADKVLWKEIPLVLAERCFYLSGVPSNCAPIVHDDAVQDGYHTWSQEQLQNMHSALERDVLKIKVRDPVSRNVIFELAEDDGTMKDSTLGFSALWRHDHLFSERAYGSLNTNTLKILNYKGLLKVLNAVEPLRIHEQLPWVSLPAKLYKHAYYLTGLPRVCTPRAVNNVFPDNVGSPSTRFRRDQRVALQRVLDSGLLMVLDRPVDRDVIFEVLEPNGTFTDDDCGFSAEWKTAMALNIRLKHTGKSNVASSLAAMSTSTTSDGPKTSSALLESVISSFVSTLLPHGLLLDTVAGPSWICLPQMLATKRLVIHGIPRSCLPMVKNDFVTGNYAPLQWALNTQVDFFNAAKQTGIMVIPRSRNQRVLYNVLEENGTITPDTLGFSEQWCKEHLDSIDLGDPNLSPSVYVIEKWLELLERAKIPCHDNMGRRHIQWSYIPTLLARGKLCIVGCPKECIPRVERDVVVEMSSPYYYDSLQTGLMYRAFLEKRVTIGIRPPGKEALFACSIGDSGYVWETILGYTEKWIEMNIRNPNPPFYMPHIMNLVPSGTTSNYSFTPAVVAPATQTQVTDRFSVQTTVMGKLSTQSASSQVAAQGVNGPSRPEMPGSSTAGSLPQKRSVSDASHSLKIRIPKRRAAATTATPFTTEPLIRVKSKSASPPPAQLPAMIYFPIPLVPAVLIKQEVPTMLSASGRAPSTSGIPLLAPIPQPMRPSRNASKRIAHNSSHGDTSTATREPTPSSKETRETLPTPSTSSSSSEADKPGNFGMRESMSPPLPPLSLLPSPLPPVPVPECLPRPGGDLLWDEEKSMWELTVSESWPPSLWKKYLPVFPARLLWDPVHKLWMCVPSETLTHPPKGTNDSGRIGLSPEVQAELDAAKRIGPLPKITEGHTIIWHRWRRTWALFEYVARVPP